MNMDLSEFIRLSISEVLKGVSEAKRDADKSGAKVNPPLALRTVTDVERKEIMKTRDVEAILAETGKRIDRNNIANLALLETKDGGVADVIEFDVAVSIASDESHGMELSGKAGLGGTILKVISADIGGTGKRSSERKSSQESVNRIKFRIIVQYP
jgi:hypothetical protein